MKESYVEGLANHNGPESCGGAREGGVEALTGVRTGRVFSRENISPGCRRREERSEGNIRRVVIARRRDPRGQRPRACTETPCTGTGRSRVHLRSRARSYREVQGHTPMMHEHGKSDGSVVPAKPSNKAEQPAAERMEGRGPAKGNAASAKPRRTQGRESVPQVRCERIRRVAKTG